MADAASCSELKYAFSTLLQKTRQHRARLDQAFRALGVEPTVETCEAIKGLIKEGSEIINFGGDPRVKALVQVPPCKHPSGVILLGYRTACMVLHTLSNRPAETRQREAEQHRADQRQGDELRPHNV